jgi:hypothetical protein
MTPTATKRLPKPSFYPPQRMKGVTIPPLHRTRSPSLSDGRRSRTNRAGDQHLRLICFVDSLIR